MTRTFVIGVGMTKFERPQARKWDYPDMGREAGQFYHDYCLNIKCQNILSSKNILVRYTFCTLFLSYNVMKSGSACTLIVCA